MMNNMSPNTHYTRMPWRMYTYFNRSWNW